MSGTGNILLYPFALIYGIVTGIRNFLYDSGVLKSTEFDIPLISVGNITVGGTGKTPHTEYLVSLLEKDFRVATLSRGYRRKTRDFRIASSSSNVKEIGDEPMQMAGKFPATLVAVDRNRVQGVRKILKHAPETQVIILDDAFQHRRITPGFSILLSDFERPFYRDHLLPFGNLRESSSNMRRADIILITKCPENLSPIQRRLIVKEIDKPAYQNLYFTTLAYHDPLPVFDDKSAKRKKPDLANCKESSLVLVTGIANPKPLKEYLEKYFMEIIQIEYPDHHSFSKTDMANIERAFNDLRSGSRYIFTTEKDAFRIRESDMIRETLKSAFYYVPVGIEFLNDDREEFDNIIADYVSKNKRNNRVSKK